MREYAAYNPDLSPEQARAAAVLEVAETIALKSLLNAAEMDAYDKARKNAGL